MLSVAVPVLLFVIWAAGPGADAEECKADARRDNRLIERLVLEELPPGSVRSVARFGEVEPDPDCDSTDQRGGITALFDGLTAHEFAERLEAEGWRRIDPAAGRPAWDTHNEQPGNGMDAPWIEPDDGAEVTDRWDRPRDSTEVIFLGDKSDRDLWVRVDRDGLDAQVDAKSFPQFVRSLWP